MFSVVVHLVELVSNHMLRWIGLKLVTMWIAQKCISVNARIHIQSGLKLVRNCSVNRPGSIVRDKLARDVVGRSEGGYCLVSFPDLLLHQHGIANKVLAKCLHNY